MTMPDPTLAAIRERLKRVGIATDWAQIPFPQHVIDFLSNAPTDVSVLLTRLNAAERELNEWKRFGTPLYMRAVHNRMTKAEDKLDDAEQVVAALRLVEWSAYDECGTTDKSDHLCPECTMHQTVGHSDDCTTGNALAVWDTQKKKPSKEGENK